VKLIKQIALLITVIVDDLTIGMHDKVFIANLQVLFIGLKLTGHITWPWLFVLSPVLITAWLFFILVMIVRTGREEEDES